MPRLKLSIEYSIDKQKNAAVGKVFLKKPYCDSEEACRNVLKSIRCIKLKQLILNDDTIVPGTPECEEFASREAEQKIEAESDDSLGLFRTAFWKNEKENDASNSAIVRFSLDKKNVKDAGLTPRDIAEAVENFFNGWPVETRFSSPDSEGEWIVKIRVYDVARFAAPSKSASSVASKKWKTREQAAKILNKQAAGEIAKKNKEATKPSNERQKSKSKSASKKRTREETVEKTSKKSKSSTSSADAAAATVKIVIEDVSQANETLKRMGKSIACELRKRLHVSGIRGIKGGQVTTYEHDVIERETGAIIRRKEWMVETKRSVLKKLMGLPCVDASRTYSTNSHEIEMTFGIVGTKTSLINAIKDALGSENRIDGRHLDVLVSTMTHLGYVVRVSRFGLNKLDTGTMTRASFEETVYVLGDAAMHREVDPLREPTSCLITGQMAPMGGALIAVKPKRAYAEHIVNLKKRRKKELTYDMPGFKMELPPGVAWSACFERTVACALAADEDEEKRKARETLDVTVSKPSSNTQILSSVIEVSEQDGPQSYASLSKDDEYGPPGYNLADSPPSLRRNINNGKEQDTGLFSWLQ